MHQTSGKLLGTAGCCLLLILDFMFVFRVLHEHIQRLSKVVTANHKALQIPEVRTSFLHSVRWSDGVCDRERIVLLYILKRYFCSHTAEIPCRENTLHQYFGIIC